MITIHQLNRESYASIMRMMLPAIKDVTHEYDTVTIEMSPATDIDTNNMLKYITLKHGTKFVHINYSDFHYITIA